MKRELFYFNSAINRKLINLCSSSSVYLQESKQKFLLLPDRQMSFVKILELPPAPGSKLRDMIRFQITRIYPGSSEDVTFDFIPFKTGTGWKVVLYIIKDKYIREIFKDERFEGIVLSLQLLLKKEMYGLSCLVIYYPDMVELWNFKNGIPVKVERLNTEDFSIKKCLSLKNNTIYPEKLMTIYPYNETHKWEVEKERGKKFSETLNSIRRDEICFPEYRAGKTDRITPAVVVTAFIISLVLLAMTASKQHELAGEEKEAETRIENIRVKTAKDREVLEIIEGLDNKLSQIRKNTPVNVYNLLLRTRKAINSDSVVLSFGLKGKEWSLTLRSRSALSDLEGILSEFGNVRASNIRTLDDGNKSYTVWAEIDR